MLLVKIILLVVVMLLVIMLFGHFNAVGLNHFCHGALGVNSVGLKILNDVGTNSI